jgi:peroxiredoxin
MAKSIHLKFNDPAPDLQVLNTEGEQVQLSSLWKKKPVILAFARHFGCPQCKEMVERLVGVLIDMESKGLSLAIITQGTPETAKAFCTFHAPGVMCLADPERKAYHGYGLERANLWQSFLSPSILSSNLRLWRDKGWRTEWPPKGQDALQLAGTFVIGTDGRVRLPYYYDNISDHPPVDLLLHGIMGVNWKMPFQRPIVASKNPAKYKIKK